MLNSRLMFNERIQEIEVYADFLKLIERPRTEICYKEEKYTINNDVKSILKANVYLLTYNIVEATVRSVFKDIYAHLRMNAVAFEDLHDDFKLEVIKNAQKNLKTITIDNINEKVLNLSQDIIHATFDEKK